MIWNHGSPSLKIMPMLYIYLLHILVSLMINISGILMKFLLLVPELMKIRNLYIN